jgi:hypothetical protein
MTTLAAAEAPPPQFQVITLTGRLTRGPELVGVNIETVRRAVRSGQLGVAGRIGRSPRFSWEAIDRWLPAR